MMITVTEQKPLEEIMQYLEKCQTVYIAGCGTCPTITHTGGKTEVLEMKEKLEAAGKKVSGWMVIPTACDIATGDILREDAAAVDAADCILVMSCAFGVQMVALHTKSSVYPALNSMFMGLEDSPGHFIGLCQQCGACLLGRTAAICPLVRCAKSLLNGPCGGSVGGKCEISADIPCAWQLIVDRLKELGQLENLDEIVPPQDWSTSNSGGPRQITLGAYNE